MKRRDFLKYSLASSVTVPLLGACGEIIDEVEVDAAPDSSRYHFNIYGDSRKGNHVYAALALNALKAGAPEFTLHMGDMITTPDDAVEWPIFRKLTQLMIQDSDLYMVVGNHDVDDQNSLEMFRSVFPNYPTHGYYSQKLGTGYGIFLNSEELFGPDGGLGDRQMHWLETELASSQAQESEFILVSVHRPPFPQTKYEGENFRDYKHLHGLFSQHNVSLVLSGHEHSFGHEEQDGVHYVITGGGGSNLYENESSSYFHYLQSYVLNDRILCRCVDLYGNTQNEIEIPI